MIVQLLPLLLLTLKTSRCSLIIDKAYQTGIHLSDYCPNMKYCREGAHTMCVYYDPNHVMGPRCYNSANVTMTAALANQLLDVANMIKSKIALGVETGKDKKLLPRGYGMFRLKWDSELATFAQVLANQCLLKHDMCRATKRFPHPSQTIGLVRFKHPDWDVLNNAIKMAKGLTNEKLVYTVTHSLKSWYAQKSVVTEDMVQTYPDWSTPPYYNQKGRLYLNMIHGPATHMGCGISGYSEYVHVENALQGKQNSLQVVCNFSSGARKGTHTYETEPPIPGQGFSAKCGCPPGSKEDADCLCIEASPDPQVVPPQPTCPLGETSSYCDPALVLLPIFTIEDAPPNKLYQFAENFADPLKNYILQRVNNTSDAVNVQNNVKPTSSLVRARSSNEMFDMITHENGAENAIFQRAYTPSSVQSTAPPSKRNNSSEVILGKNWFKPKARARTSQELLEFIGEKGKENALSWPHANKPSSVEMTALSLNKEQQSSPQFRLGPDFKPPLLPPPPPRQPPALRRSPPARPHSRHRPPPPPPPLPPPPRIPPPPPPPLRIEQYSSALQTHFEPRPAKPTARDRKSRPPPKLPPKHHQKKKASIFTRVAQFQLPDRRSASPIKVLKKDVEPRKDFSNLNQVVNDYLKQHPGYRIINGNNEQTQPTKDTKPHAEEKAQTEAVATESGLNRVEETVIKFDQYLDQKNSSNYNDKDVDIKDDNDNKLLSLLDTLEREVKHITLDGDEKQLLDAKIRKIYGTIVGRTALQQFPKPILFSTPDPEAAEIDFGETKSRDQLETNRVENDHLKVTDKPKQKKRFIIDQKVERVKHPSPFVQGHIWKNKFVESFNEKKYNPDVSNNGDKKSSDIYDHKYNDNNLENTYGDIQHQRMDELDHKHNENLNKRYNENHLDHEYDEIPRKFDESFDHPHHYNKDRKYNDDEPAARSKMKYQADRAVFREFEHNSLGSQEDITPRNYINQRANRGPLDNPLITKDRDKRKRTEKKHNKRVKSLGSRNENDILSLERRKYYQEKLDNIKRKLRGRRNGRKSDPKNERSLRPMHMKIRETPRMRSKDQADQFYMPERARFLHGF